MTTGKRGQTLVMGAWCWGAGDTLQEAKQKFQAQRGRLSDGYLILVFDASTEFLGVDEIGRYHYRGETPTRTLIPPRRQKASMRPHHDAAPHTTRTGPAALANQSHPAAVAGPPPKPANRAGHHS